MPPASHPLSPPVALTATTALTAGGYLELGAEVAALATI